MKAEVIDVDIRTQFPSKLNPLDLNSAPLTSFYGKLVGSKHTAPKGLSSDRSHG